MPARPLRRLPTLLLALIAVVDLAAASAGIAVAATASSSTTTCANKTTGALRVAKKCTTKEKKYVFGVRGPTGKTGAKGASGKNGVVNGYFASNDNTVDILPNQSNGQTQPVFADKLLNLPAGSYLISATFAAGDAVGAPTSNNDLDCYLQFSQESNDSFQGKGVGDYQRLNTDPGTFEPVALLGSVTFDSTGTLYVTCDYPEDNGTTVSGEVENIRLVATPVASLRATTYP